ncbi:hypothetical protein ACJIZ3_007118 [Penstemon smallii]|uniref:Uncharacterized protein n=1 Tax=Penstemon smallii TaxID=265156 RepID=A0ABD3S9L5_9LAMI
MGGGGSSSKRKSSKKKRDKTSQMKKKSRRKESKKRSRDYDSVSSYSDDDSSNSECSSSPILKSDYKRKIRKSKKLHRREYSVSSYSDDISKTSDSDSDYKSKKPKRRSRIASKGKTKKPKKRYNSSDSDEDAHRSRKRKRSTRDPRKKSSKKKSKKHLSSSPSSDSQSYGKRQKSKLVMLREEIEIPQGEESEWVNRKPKVRSPSCSSFSRDGDHIINIGYSDEALAPASNSRRLKSVITIVNQSHEEEDILENDPNKEEIVYDYNDYPSPKSLDSNEGGSQPEVGEEVTELGKSGIHGDHQVNDAHTNNFEKENETNVSVPVAALGGDDLETILRQKALENLRKFKGGIQRSTVNLNTNNENDVKVSSSKEVDIIENKSTTNQGSTTTQEVNQRSGLTLERDFSRLNEVKGEHVEAECGIDKLTVTQLPNEKNSTSSSSAVSVQGEPRSDIIPSAGAATNACCNSSNKETTSSSSSRPISEEHSLEDQQNESNKDSSQFEQKTMAVMRGGEMVQVRVLIYLTHKQTHIYI